LRVFLTTEKAEGAESRGGRWQGIWFHWSGEICENPASIRFLICVKSSVFFWKYEKMGGSYETWLRKRDWDEQGTVIVEK